MQKRLKKLALHRETLKHLSTEAMGRIAAGTDGFGVVRRKENTDIEITGVLCGDVAVETWPWC